MKKMFCPKPWENVLIEVNGDVYFCCFAHRPKGMIGSLQAESLAEVWEGRKARDIRKTIMAGKIPQPCLDCEIFRFEKGWVQSLRKLYLGAPFVKSVLSRSRPLLNLKNRLRNVLYNFANLKK